MRVMPGDQVQAGGVAFEHAIGDHDQPVTGLQGDVGGGVARVGEHAEWDVHRQHDRSGSPGAAQVGGVVAGVDHGQDAGGQVQAPQHAGGE